MSPNKILCVAEKPSIAKAVANILGGGNVQVRNVTGAQFNKNYEFDFDFGGHWGHCQVVMTSVLGHLTNAEFDQEYKDWKYPPPERLFEARVLTKVAEDKVAIATNIERQAKYCKALFIWTDCDREGEHIGDEVRLQAVKGNPRIEVKRAMFSNIERAHVLTAARRPIALNLLAASAVSARIELDLRIGAAFTRLQTLTLQRMGGPLTSLIISYGSCQFPTLGFVVDRYLKVQSFVPEPFWTIKLSHTKDGQKVDFLWDRTRLFDRGMVLVLFERAVNAKYAKITKVQTKQTKKWKPLPLTTLELQKAASRWLRMTSQHAMKIAEALYNKGFISYPRTETDIFDKGMDLRGLVGKHVQHENWGLFAQGLVDGGFSWPRQGKKDDKAHPPIHPVIPYGGDKHSDEGRLYEFITRRFLACCSKDALGVQTNISLSYGPETFHTNGLTILERNYLDVYPYDKWTGTLLPPFQEGELFEPLNAHISQGETSSPGYLTEPDLLALMDANGIGTDATMAEHISKIAERGYVMTRPRTSNSSSVAAPDAPPGRGRGGRGRGGRGGGGGGGQGQGQGGGGGATGMQEFIPTNLGVALISGYDAVGFEENLSKPFLRKELEIRLKDICEGKKTKEEVVKEEVRLYRRVFRETEERIEVLRRSCRRFIFEPLAAQGGG